MYQPATGKRPKPELSNEPSVRFVADLYAVTTVQFEPPLLNFTD